MLPRVRDARCSLFVSISHTPHLTTQPPVSFLLQCLGRVDAGGLNGVDARRGGGEQEHNESGTEKPRHAHLDLHREGIEPPLHPDVGHRRADQGGQRHEENDFPRQHAHDPGRGCAEGFANPVFSPPLPGGDGDQAQQSEAGEEERESCRGAKDLAEAAILTVQLVEPAVEELGVERLLWRETVLGHADLVHHTG